MPDLTSVLSGVVNGVFRALGGIFHVELPPADQTRYRGTAGADTKAIIGHRSVVIIVGLVALAGTEASTFLSANELSTVEKIVLAALAAGVGAVIIILPLVYLGALVAAPHRQQRFKTRRVAELEQANASLGEHERTEAQFAAALRAAELLPNAGLEALDLEWFRATKVLVADVFGDLEGVKFDAQGGLEARQQRLDALAGRLGDGTLREPSKRWTERAKLIGKFNDLLWEMNKEGDRLKDELLAKEPDVGRANVDEWLDELQTVLNLLPDFFRHTFNSDPVGAMMTAEYQGIDDPTINMAITLLDRRLPYISNVLYPLRNYVQAVSGT
jgi:hypothetical protein